MDEGSNKYIETSILLVLVEQTIENNTDAINAKNRVFFNWNSGTQRELSLSEVNRDNTSGYWGE